MKNLKDIAKQIISESFDPPEFNGIDELYKFVKENRKEFAKGGFNNQVNDYLYKDKKGDIRLCRTLSSGSSRGDSKRDLQDFVKSVESGHIAGIFKEYLDVQVKPSDPQFHPASFNNNGYEKYTKDLASGMLGKEIVDVKIELK